MFLYDGRGECLINLDHVREISVDKTGGYAHWGIRLEGATGSTAGFLAVSDPERAVVGIAGALADGLGIAEIGADGSISRMVG